MCYSHRILLTRGGDLLYTSMIVNVDHLQNTPHKAALEVVGLSIFYFIYMKRDWAEHRCYVEALSHTTCTIVLT